MFRDAYRPTAFGQISGGATVDARGSAREPNVEARGSARELNVEARGIARELNAEARELNAEARASGWLPVSIELACPTCGEHAGCCVHELEPFVCCVNVHSEWPLTTGGWLHSAPLTGSDHAPGWLSSVRDARISFVSRRALLRAGRSEA